MDRIASVRVFVVFIQAENVLLEVRLSCPEYVCRLLFDPLNESAWPMIPVVAVVLFILRLIPLLPESCATEFAMFAVSSVQYARYGEVVGLGTGVGVGIGVGGVVVLTGGVVVAAGGVLLPIVNVVGEPINLFVYDPDVSVRSNPYAYSV